MKTAKQVLDELSETFASNDFEAMLRLFDENCVVREAPDLPFGGDWTGRDGVAALSARQAEYFEMVPTSLGVYEIDESRLIMHTSMQMTSRATGAQETIPIMEMYTVRDGLIIEAFPFYWDAAAVTRLAATDHPVADGQH
ncbi:nuclear transport factor 2 family protein [Nocardia rhamnosiphila]